MRRKATSKFQSQKFADERTKGKVEVKTACVDQTRLQRIVQSTYLKTCWFFMSSLFETRKSGNKNQQVFVSRMHSTSEKVSNKVSFQVIRIFFQDVRRYQSHSSLFPSKLNRGKVTSS